MRRHLNYANAAATLALFFAMSGGALAAKHYLVNSAKQINPKVLKSLTGKRGATGAAGKEGPQGKEGSPGKNGANGANGSSDVVAGFKNGPVFLPFSSTVYTTIASLVVPSGKWTVLAKANITNNAGAGNTDARCQLVSPSGDFDEMEVALEDINTAGSAHAGTLAMNVNTELPSGGTINLNCRNEGGGNSNARFIKITALQAANLSNSAIP